MNEIITQLASIAEQLDSKSLVRHANAIDAATKSLVQVKKAQYLGVQAYWLQNGRCWQNCYRQKRAKSQSKPAQEVWMDCWEEYKKSINDQESDWFKYANNPENGLVKIASKKGHLHINNKFAQSIQSSVKNGSDIGAAVVAAYEDDMARLPSTVLSSLNHISLVAKSLQTREPQISKKLVTIADNLTKEALMGGMMNGVKDWVANTGIGQGTQWGKNRRSNNNDQRYEQIMQMINQKVQNAFANPNSPVNPAKNNSAKQALIANIQGLIAHQVAQLKGTDPATAALRDNLNNLSKGGLNQIVNSHGTNMADQHSQQQQQQAQQQQMQLQMQQNRMGLGGGGGGGPNPGAVPAGVDAALYHQLMNQPGTDLAAKYNAMQTQIQTQLTGLAAMKSQLGLP